MSARPMRRAARALARHAAQVMPRAHADWARAMGAEIDHIRNDADALRWALGCVWAGYCVRSAEMSRPVLILLRTALGGAIALYALSQLSIALMVLGYKVGNPDLAAATDGAVAGDDYTRYAALMDQMPMAYLWASFAQVALYLVGAATLVFGWRRAPVLLAAAVGTEIISKIVMRSLPAFAETFRDGAMQDTIVIAGLAAICAAAFWVAAQNPRRPA